VSDYRYEKALMLTLANISYDATIIVDKDLTVIAINNTAEELFPHAQPIGTKLEDLSHVPELSMMVNDALINEEDEFEEQISIKERWYRVRTQVFRRDGYHFIGLALRDITQLVKLNRARRDMVANISHELRTPIANIRLIIDGLFHDQDKPKRKDSIDSLRAVARETDNLLWLVQEMSDLSMIESGQAIVRLTEHRLVDLVAEAMERMEDRAEAANIRLVRHVPDRLRVLCDRDLVQRVLVNLIHNAVKWSPAGEAITVNATNGGDEIKISVLDNGPGVPSDAVDRIFERFYQIDASRSVGEGTGLGLAICRHIVEAHGGRIWAESNADGGGGRFLFTLLSVDDSIA
jgi:two-component system phosphate regulon sensor histidine kinase PhoR